MTDQIDVATDGIVRCLWPGMDKFYMEYHDNEWGVPIGDDDALFERICLEGFQSGLFDNDSPKEKKFSSSFQKFQY